jgi:hypothetical protein
VGTSSARANFFGGSALSAIKQVEAANALFSNQGRFVAQIFGSSGASNDPQYIFARHKSDSVGGNSVVASGDRIGSTVFLGSDGTNFIPSAEIRAEVDGTPGTNDMPGRLVFSTTADGASSPTERMRITSSGWLKASNTGDYYGINASIHEFNSNQNSGVLKIHSRITSGYTDAVLTSEFTGYTPNNTTARFLYCGDTTAERCTIRSDGGIANFSANNVNLSDRNYKKDIAPAAGTWDCLKAWEIVNFRYKDQLEGSDLNMGVIAQQVAESCPEVITVFQKAKEATDTEPAQEERLGVKDQQMMWMAIKTLQEAQARIETLEAKVAALEAS